MRETEREKTLAPRRSSSSSRRRRRRRRGRRRAGSGFFEPLPQRAGPPEDFRKIGGGRRKAPGCRRERRRGDLSGFLGGVGLRGELLARGAEAAEAVSLVWSFFCSSVEVRERERERKRGGETRQGRLKKRIRSNPRAVLDCRELCELRLGREGPGDGGGDGARRGRRRRGGGGLLRSRFLRLKKIARRRFGHRRRRRSPLLFSSLSCCSFQFLLSCSRLGLDSHQAIMQK